MASDPSTFALQPRVRRSCRPERGAAANETHLGLMGGRHDWPAQRGAGQPRGRDTIVLEIFVFENYTWCLASTDLKGMGDIPTVCPPPTLKQNKATFKCIVKIHALEYKDKLFNNYFSSFYINFLRMSDSYSDVMSSPYTCKLPLVNK